ncbi:hypothetical protein BGZ72_004079 [Mortierella alpina]|nr:hypothetical protein BGZ72_004079 [Mortierella alpina]
MAQFSKSPFLALAAFLLLQLTLLSSQQTLVQAGPYSFQTPTGATRWTVGQPGQINIVSKERAKANTSPTDKLFKVTLERRKDGLFGGRTTITTIRDRLQLLIPAANPQQTEVTMDINDWLIPANVPPGNNYFVRLELDKNGVLDLFPESAETPVFQIVAAAIPGNTTTTMTMTNTLATPTATTASIAPTPTSSCLDVKEQCAAQGKVYQEASGSSPCSCGADLIVPTIVPNAASGSIKSTVKSTFKSTGGPTAAFAVLILVVMTLF